eukprot:TRINITY_DN5928_c0_g1_i2.p1 TRINITY_DN5928_c0_g1~~TRINITY_DN5928_c0_g1_i2.p1  ORF type:complete len:1240 (+),score=239.82 TRINITY_DN5928_c0_g1_i2:112-3831(+)
MRRYLFVSLLFACCWVLALSQQLTVRTLPFFGLTPSRRRGAASCVLNGDLVIFGGSSKGTAYASGYERDTWRYTAATDRWRYIVPFNTQNWPVGRVAAALACFNDRMFIHGGRNDQQILDDLWVFTEATQTWISISSTDGPSARYYHATAVRGNEFYLLGGLEKLGFNNDMWAFQMDTYLWRQVPHVLNGLQAGCGMSLDYWANTDQLVSFGGQYSWIDVPIESNDVYIFNFTTLAWSLLPTTDIKPAARYSFGSSVQNDRLFIFGGFSDVTRADMADCWQLNLWTGVWQKLSMAGSNPSFRSDLVFRAVNNNTGLLFSGWGSALFNDIYRVDWGSNTWSLVRDVRFTPEPRFDHVSVCFAQSLMIYGGTSATNVILADHWTFDLVAATWQSVTSFTNSPGARTQAAAVYLGDQMFLVGGMGGTTPNPVSSPLFNDVWRFSQLQFKWELLDVASTQPEPRCGHVITYLNSDIFLFGGRNAAIYFNDLWRFSVTTLQWTQISTPGVVPSARIRPAIANIYNPFDDPAAPNRFLIMGGMDAAVVQLLDVWVFNPLNNTWTSHPVAGMPAGSGVALFVSGSQLLAHAGAWYSSLYNGMVLGQIRLAPAGVDQGDPIVFTWVNSTGWSGPLVSHSIAPSDSRAIIYGGYSTYDAYLGSLQLNSLGVNPVRTAARSQVWSIDFSPLCPLTRVGTRTIQNLAAAKPGSPCFACAAGSIATMNANGVLTCTLCPAGSFSALPGQTECELCRPGSVNSYTGSYSALACTLCPQGSYNPLYGQRSCTPCPVGKTCPLGSLLPQDNAILTRNFTSIQSVPLQSHTAEVLNEQSFWGVALLVTLFGLLLLYSTFPSSLKRRFHVVDILFTQDHAPRTHQERYLREWTTGLGGWLTLLTIVMAVFVFGILALPWVRDNVVEHRSQIPTVAVDTQQQQLVQGTFALNLQVINYPENCTTPGTTQCHPLITLAISGMSVGSSQLSCRQVTGGLCAVSWICRQCRVSQRSASLAFTFDQPNSMATSLAYNVTTSTGIRRDFSSSDQFMSSVASSIVSSSLGRVLRGRIPTQVYLDTLPTLYQDAMNELVTWGGYHVDLNSQIRGQEVDGSDIFYTSRLGVTFIFLQLDMTFLVRHSPAQTNTIFAISILNALTAIFAGMRVLLLLLECCQDYRDRKKEAMRQSLRESIRNVTSQDAFSPHFGAVQPPSPSSRHSQSLHSFTRSGTFSFADAASMASVRMTPSKADEAAGDATAE